MKENLHDIDKLFKAALDVHEETPSMDVWNAIDKNLDKNKVVDINRKYIQLKRVAAALLILLLGAGVYTLSTWKTTREQADNNNLKSNNPGNDTRSLTNTQNKQENITGSNTKNIVTTVDNERPDKISGKPALQKNELHNRGGIKVDPDLINSTVVSKQRDEEILNTPVGGKIIIAKRTKKTILANSGFGEIENKTGKETLNINSLKKENAGLRNLTILPEINPEILKAKPVASNKKNIFPVSGILPGHLTTKALPDKKMKIKKAPAFDATIFFAPNISSNLIKDDKHERRPGRPDEDRDKIRKEEQHQISTTFGVLIGYNMNKHLSLQSGISLSNTSIRINPKIIYADMDNTGAVKYRYNFSSGYLFLSPKSGINPAVGDSIRALESSNTLQYASIPFAVKYNYSLKKIDLSASIGTSINILTKSIIKTEIGDGPNKEENTSNKIIGLKSKYFSGNISIGASYKITDRIALSFLPAYNFALSSSTKDATVKSYPNTISLVAGIRYRL